MSETGEGEKLSHRKLYEIRVSQQDLFTPEQLDILRSIIQGKGSIKEIAKDLKGNPETIKSHLYSHSGIMERAQKATGVKKIHSQNKLLWLLLKQGILELVPAKGDLDEGYNL